MKRCAIALAAFFSIAMLAARGEAAQLTLVEDGVARVPIVVFEDAPRFTRMAADELAEYIEKVSGAKPEVIEGEPDPIPEHAVWVGYQPAMDGLFPGVDFDFQHAEEILIAANENHLAIAGRDRWHPDHMVQELPRGREVHGVQKEYGTVNAVYTFLQDCLDVRWLWPGQYGEDIIEQKTIAFAPFEYRHRPQFRGRVGIFRAWMLDRKGFRPRGGIQDWVRFHRLLFDSMNMPGGHAFVDWWERFHETHPEYLALQPDGTRGGGEKPYPSADTVKICHSNPDVWQQWLADVEKEIERNPNKMVFNASPNDGFTAGHCICEDCRAWDHPDGEKLPFTWQGLSQQYVALSDRHVTFANKLARMLKERYPDRDYYVRMGAYGNWRPVPVEARPDDNVISSIVANFHNRKYVGRTGLAEDAKARFLRWGKVAPNLVWRPNLGFGIWQFGLPRVAMDKAVSDLRLAAEQGVIAIFFDTVWGHWSTQGPHYYMLARMAWDPYADGEAILQDYYRRAFGKAVGALEDYWTLMADTTREIVFGEVPWYEAYNAEFFKEANAHLDRGLEAVEDEADIYRERIGFVRHGLEYTKAMVKVRGLMARFRESDGQDTEAEDAARELWIETIWPLASSEKYPMAINATAARPGHPRSLKGMYPEDLHRRW